MVASARITSKGQITIPKAVRDQLDLRQGDALEFHFVDDRVEVRPKRRRSIAEFRGLFAMEHTLPFEEERRLAWEARAREFLREDIDDIDDDA